MILFNKHFDIKIENLELHPQGRWIILKFIIEDKEMCLINLYGPNGDEPTFFEDINKAINGTKFVSDYYIMVGDYNIII